jgi:hypothetical protein
MSRWPASGYRTTLKHAFFSVTVSGMISVRA